MTVDGVGVIVGVLVAVVVGVSVGLCIGVGVGVYVGIAVGVPGQSTLFPFLAIVGNIIKIEAMRFRCAEPRVCRQSK